MVLCPRHLSEALMVIHPHFLPWPAAVFLTVTQASGGAPWGVALGLLVVLALWVLVPDAPRVPKTSRASKAPARKKKSPRRGR